MEWYSKWGDGGSLGKLPRRLTEFTASHVYNQVLSTSKSINQRAVWRLAEYSVLHDEIQRRSCPWKVRDVRKVILDSPCQFIKKKRERTQVKSWMKEERSQWTLQKNKYKEYYKKLYTKNLGNLEEMGKFRETYKLPKLKQEEYLPVQTNKEVKKLNQSSKISEQTRVQ